MPEIRIAGGDTAFDCESGDTMLRAALRAGLGFPYECNVGSCGNCRFELLSGDVRQEREAPPGLTEKDRQKGNRFLGCQAHPLTDCTVKVRLFDHYRSLHRPKRTRATLTETIPVTHDITEFRFRLAEAAPFLPGQYALFTLPGVTGQRAYSMCNVPDDGAGWHFLVKRVPRGAGSTVLFDKAAAGDAFAIDGPYGMAYLREDAPRDILCLAGGSGLSPMVSIARAAAASPKLADREIHFLYGGRATRDICGESMLSNLPGFGARIHYSACASRPEEDPQNIWRGRCGLIHEVTREVFGERLPGFEIYFAGPPAMAKAMQLMLYEMKVPQDQVHFDQFY
jgi:toluene monooxygenase electron transfer component